MTDEQRQHAVAAIQQALPALEWTLQPAKIKRLSRDFHWFSPLLTEQLAGKQADAVVRPRDEEELRQLVCACAQHQLPLTLRGSATGNYGQLVPLEGGLLVDMTGLNQIVALGNGTVRAQAGIRLADIETAARQTGWELRCMPSTYRLASLGGLYGGGFGGIALTKVQEDFPPEIVGTATGMINIYSYIGTALLQLASGWIMEAQAPGQAAYGIGQYASMFILFMAMFVTAFSATLLGLGKSRGNVTDVFSPMGEGETKSA